MTLQQMFVIFDYENDHAISELLLSQSRQPDSPFILMGRSAVEHAASDSLATVRALMAYADIVCVLCGRTTDMCQAVSRQFAITLELRRPYFLLHGYDDKATRKPSNAEANDKIYDWTWRNLQLLVSGRR